MDVAKTIIAVVNDAVPFSYGDARVPVEKINLFVHDNRDLEYAQNTVPTEQEVVIGKYCAELIPDGVCLQMGVGGLLNALAFQ